MTDAYRQHGTILVGDCLEHLRTLPDCSVDSVVTDPPYGLSDHAPKEVIACLTAWLAGEPYKPKGKGFMGKSWDAWVPGPEVWRECLRVLKPGGHLVAFAGTRSMDLMAMAVRLAGFELRDAIGHAEDSGNAPLLAWVYGSGFPKSHNGEWGGTALKPAWEPIILARKPLEGTVAANVLAHGTGALNIDGCRIGYDKDAPNPATNPLYRAQGGYKSAGNDDSGSTSFSVKGRGEPSTAHEQGRWPANVIHDGSEEVLACFPDAPGQQGDLTGNEPSAPFKNAYGEMGRTSAPLARGDSGSAARFFYCAKTSRADRNDGCAGMPLGMPLAPNGAENAIGSKRGSNSKPRENIHPTVKPTDLMRWLCRLVTPQGGVVLDPFMGSGSTGRGAVLEGFTFIGIELSPEYAAIAEARLAAAIEQRRIDTAQPGLFGEAA